LRARGFGTRGAACASARCDVRCCCCARGVMLRAVLLALQPVAACGATALREELCCARCLLCFSPLRLLRAVMLALQPVAACGAAAVREELCCARCCLSFSPLRRAVLLLCARSSDAHGAASASALSSSRRCCYARGALLHTGLLVLQLEKARGVTAVYGKFAARGAAGASAG
jgi:hypothetical protein